MTSPQPTPPRDLRLTPRGRVVLAVLALLAVLGLMLLVRSCSGGSGTGRAATTTTSTVAAGPATPSTTLPSPTRTTTSASATATATATATTGASTTRATQKASTPGVTAGSDGIKHSGMRGDGTWTTAALSIKPARQTRTVHRYAVQVEGGTDIDPAEAATQIAGILNDPRGWIGEKGASFELVPDAGQAEFTIFVASPPTTDRKCLPLRTLGTWSCRSGDDVILNADRWTLMTPTYTDLDAYRAYMVNHEVGHFLGHGHQQCGGAGRNAPVMMQQSKGIGSCRPNPWPSADGKQS